MKLLESDRRGEEVAWEKRRDSVEAIQTFTCKVVQLLLKKKDMGLFLSVSGGGVREALRSGISSESEEQQVKYSRNNQYINHCVIQKVKPDNPAK